MIKYLHLKDSNWTFTSHKTALFIDRKVLDLWSGKILKLEKPSIEVFPLLADERIKSREMKNELEDILFEKGYTKDSTFIAIGGGALSDLIGYLAATFCRGVSLILIPTTLVAMIDAGIGGKNGINTPYGKNLIGTIYEPCEIWIDPIFLSTLSFDQIQEGYVEMLKHGLILDGVHFSEVARLNTLKQMPTLDVMQRSIEIKQFFVQRDQSDQNRRQILNFGHTFAHGLEKLSHYQITHGHAVAIGIVIESYISYVEEGLSLDDFEKICDLFMPIVRNISHPSFSAADWEKTLLLDKKNKRGKIHTVRLKKIGEGALPKPLSKDVLIDALNWFEHACLCRR